jgi:hypothetical protein
VAVQRRQPWYAQLNRQFLIRRLALVLAVVGVAAVAYQAGRNDMLAGFWNGGLTASYVQIGNDTPGQPFALAVDNLSADVSIASTPQASGAPTCDGSTIREGFESGEFPNSAFVGVAVDGEADVQPAIKRDGQYAALASSTDTKGSYAYVRFGICPGTALDVSADFWIEREGAAAGNVPLFRIFRGDGSRLMSVFRQNGAGDRLFIQVGDDYQRTIGVLPLHTWSTIALHASYPKGTIRLVELIVDGKLVYNTGR